MVYAKRPFKGPEQVFRYLARYTISDSRIVAFDGERVSLRHRKPAGPGRKKPRYGTMTVTADEFIRRFLLHVLPGRMHRIRYFGILANDRRATTLEGARKALGTVGCTIPGETADEPEGDHDQGTAPVACPHCGGVLRRIRDLPRRKEPLTARGPPRGITTPRRGAMNQPLASKQGSAGPIPAHRPTRPRRWPADTFGLQPAKAPKVRRPNRPPHRPTSRKPAKTLRS